MAILYCYKLLKDLPGLKAGAKFSSDNYEDNFNKLTFTCNDKFYSFPESEIKDYPDWFQKTDLELSVLEKFADREIKEKSIITIENTEINETIKLKGYVTGIRTDIAYVITFMIYDAESLK